MSRLELYSFGHLYRYIQGYSVRDVREVASGVALGAFGFTKCGLDPEVQALLMEQSDFKLRLEQLIEEIRTSNLQTMYIGCKGGFHRSVALVELISKEFPGATVVHMDVEKEQDSDFPLKNVKETKMKYEMTGARMMELLTEASSSSLAEEASKQRKADPQCEVCLNTQPAREWKFFGYCSSCEHWAGRAMYPASLPDQERKDVLGGGGWIRYLSSREVAKDVFEGKQGEWFVRGECGSFVGPYSSLEEGSGYFEGYWSDEEEAPLEQPPEPCPLEETTEHVSPEVIERLLKEVMETSPSAIGGTEWHRGYQAGTDHMVETAKAQILDLKDEIARLHGVLAEKKEKS